MFHLDAQVLDYPFLDSDRQAPSTARFRRAGLLASADVMIMRALHSHGDCRERFIRLSDLPAPVIARWLVLFAQVVDKVMGL